jgi:hypothetical protein
VRTAVAALVASLAVAGCGIGAMFAPIPDDLSAWQAIPLAPDPGLTDKAAHHPACRIDVQDGVALEIVLQDRRTASTAVFLVKGPTTVGSCYVSPTGGGGGSQPAGQLLPLDEPVSVDEDGSGGDGADALTYLGGRLMPEIRQVVITVPGGPAVTASVGNGHWLAWWPGAVRASSVIGLDANGAQLFTLVWSNGWEAA